MEALSRQAEFIGYCAADLADSMRIIGGWPVAEGRCQHDGCGILISGSTEDHIRACHWAGYRAMREPFRPPGWQETSPGLWTPDAEGSGP